MDTFRRRGKSGGSTLRNGRVSKGVDRVHPYPGKFRPKAPFDTLYQAPLTGDPESRRSEEQKKNRSAVEVAIRLRLWPAWSL